MGSSDTGMLFTCNGRLNSAPHSNMLYRVHTHSLEEISNNNIPEGAIFRQDNPPYKTSRDSRNCLERENKRVMDWFRPVSPLKSHRTFLITLREKSCDDYVFLKTAVRSQTT